jgi:FkbM family methyltransferase
MYSQNDEDDLILSYFETSKKNVLEIGANDGITLSNSRLFIENGWSAHLIEPSDIVFNSLVSLYSENNKVNCYKLGIADSSGSKVFYESGSLLGIGDYALVSSLDKKEIDRWTLDDVSFATSEAFFLTWQDFLEKYNLQNTDFNYISIDAEGYDWLILQQIDLSKHNCEVLCIEWNSVSGMDSLFENYASQHGLYEIHRNGINIIFAKNK